MSTLVPENLTLSDVDLDDEVGCAVNHNHLTQCGRAATWRVFWHRFPCGHQQKPGHVCELHRETLTGTPVWIGCERCHARCPAAEHVARVEAL